MLGEVFRLEWRQQVRSPAFALAAVALGIYSAWSLQDVSALLARPGVASNAPALTALLIAMLGLAGIVFIPLYVTAAILRDIECRSEEIILSTHVSRNIYVGGRILAAYAIGMSVVLVCVLGVIFGQFMPWVDQGRIGPTPWYALLWSTLVLVAPNTLLVTVFVSLIASRMRSLRATYVALILFELVRFAAERVLPSLVTPSIAALLDPYGVHELLEGILHSSVNELNCGVPSMPPAFIANRVLWLMVSAIMLVVSCISFTPRTYSGPSARQQKGDITPGRSERDTAVLRHALQRFTAFTRLTQVWSLYRSGVVTLTYGASFAITVCLCIAAVVFCLIASGQVSDGDVLPSGSVVFEGVRQGVHWIIYSAVAFCAGELTWRDRECGFAEASDAYPVGQGVRIAASELIVLTVVVILQGVGGLTGYLWHVGHGLGSIKSAAFVQAMVIDAAPYALFGILALCLQLITNNRYVGYAFCALWLLFSEIWLPRMGWTAPALVFGHLPPAVYSDLSGAWPSATTALIYTGHWIIGSIALIAFTLAVVARSKHVSLNDRICDARTRFNGLHGVLFVCGLAAFTVTASLLLANDPINASSAVFSPQQAATYERQYAGYATKPQLRIIAIFLSADLSVSDGLLQIHVHYQLANRKKVPIEEVAVQFPPGFTVQKVGLPEHQTVIDDEDLRFAVYHLERPVPPGEEIGMDLTLTHRDSPLADNNQEVWLVPGRPFVGISLLPRIGYQPELTLSDAAERKRQDLPERNAKAPATVANNLGGNDADWIVYQAVLSTDDGRLALTSGKRVASWSSSGRTYFRYIADAPMINMPPLVFGDYATRSQQQGNVTITVFFDPSHPWNVNRLLKISSDALSAYGRYYAPYPRKNLSLVEVSAGNPPQSYPGLIVLPEDKIFSAKPAEATAIDSVYHVVAHELAHQWWGHQVIAAAAPGADVLTESLAEFSALRLYGETHSPNNTNALLDELQRHYLIGHATNTRMEPPLIHVNGQPYVAYDKGPLAFNALNTKLCDRLTQSLKEFFITHRFTSAPYPTAEGLLSKISDDCNGHGVALLNEWFRSVVLYDARLESPRARQTADGRYRVSFSVRAIRTTLNYVGGGFIKSGATSSPEVAIYGRVRADGTRAELYLGSPALEAGSGRYDVIVNEVPDRIRLDPRHFWLNRASDGTELQVVISNN